MEKGDGRVELPHALERSYPNAASGCGSRHAFPSQNRSVDPRPWRIGQHHIDETTVQKAMRIAALELKIAPRVPDQRPVLHGTAIRPNTDPDLRYTEHGKQPRSMRK